MFFFVGQPAQYIASAPFYWKTIFLLIAGANFLYLTVFGKAWRHTEDGHAGFEASLADKAMAVSSLVAWLAVLYAGRMLPFLGKPFEGVAMVALAVITVVVVVLVLVSVLGYLLDRTG